MNHLSEKLYLILVTLFCTVLVVGNIIGSKLIPAPFPSDLALCAGILTYPLTFLLGDIVSEIWGEKRARFMVYLGFFMNVTMLLIVQMILKIEPHPAWGIYAKKFGLESAAQYQNAFESVFGLSGLLVFSSLIAYLIAQWTSVRIFHFLKDRTLGRHLWLRNNMSTIVSQLIDTLVVNSLIFFIGFQMEMKLGFQIMGCIYAYKVLFALCDTPFCYLGVRLVKKILSQSSERAQAGVY